jgi:hypothetical protein
MDDDDVITSDPESTGEDGGESWLAEQARLVLLEDGG